MCQGPVTHLRASVPDYTARAHAAKISTLDTPPPKLYTDSMMTIKEKKTVRKAVATAVRTGRADIPSLAHKYDKTEAWVRLACKEFGVTPSDSNPRGQAATLRQSAAQEVAFGASTAETARKCNRSIKWAQLACSEHKVDLLRPSIRKLQTYKIIAALQNTNLFAREIAIKLHTHQQEVSRILITARKSGILFPNR